MTNELIMIKDIVVNLSTAAGRDPAVEYAISAASAFNAQITAIAFAYEPILPPVFGTAETLALEWHDNQRTRAENAARAAIAQFEEGAQRAGASCATQLIRAPVSDAADLFARAARRFDVSVVRQNDPGKPALEELVIEAALFDSGRPIVVVPYIQKGGLTLNQVLVCWDGSRNAARALADAMPFLARAKAIEVVTIRPGRGDDDKEGADIAQHLARHGLKVDVERIVAPGLDIANTILSHAADTSADFIVMGGYGHSRLREFILGGATRGILATMTVPTLMSH
jgi:nucleotide-binding universal stress UspA family protein